MSAYAHSARMYDFFASNPSHPPIASGGTLELKNLQSSVFTLAAGTYKTDPAMRLGHRFFIVTTGAVVVTNPAGTTLLSLGSGVTAEIMATSATAAVVVSSSSQYGYFDIPLNSFREVSSGDVGDTTANGGVLSSNTTPILQGADATVGQRLNWATGNVDVVASGVSLPGDLDATQDILVEMMVQGDVDGFNGGSLVSSFDGSANVTDAIVATNAASVHTASATIAASDIPDTPRAMSIAITPPAHATDAVYLYAVRVRYTRTPR